MMSYVWIVGFPRCGSASLCEALRILGWNPIHNPRNWDQLEEYDAAGDVMITAHWRELDRMFPSSQFILNTRSFESWVESLQRIPGFWQSGYLYDRYYREKVYGGCSPSDRAGLKEVWERHHDQVIDEITKGVFPPRLSVLPQPFTWEPLCRFLDKPVPNRPFPWLNRQSNRDAHVRMARR